MARSQSKRLNNMTIMELAKENSEATGDRFVPVCESTNTGEWCVVDSELKNVVARGLKFPMAVEHALRLSSINAAVECPKCHQRSRIAWLCWNCGESLGQPAAFSPNGAGEQPPPTTKKESNAK